MKTDDREDKQRQLASLRDQLAKLEGELQAEPEAWQATNYYLAYHATSGLMLGVIGAIASLLFNVIGSLVINQYPLRLIQVYLTFPLGERALSDDFDTGIALAIGCCLYLGTGMLFGMLFQVVTSRLMPNGTLGQRLGLATVLGLLLWGFNFYGVLAWLQPLLFGGNWIVEQIPAWVAAATHLVFAWTMAVIYPWGQYTPYRRQADRPAEEGA